MEKLLTKLKKIEPSKEFKERSRALILHTPQNQYQSTLSDYFVNAFNFKTAIGAAALSVVLILGGLSFINQRLTRSSLVSNMDTDNLTKEMGEFDIKFSEIDYYEDSAEKITIALNEASGKQLTPEEKDILEKLSL